MMGITLNHLDLFPSPLDMVPWNLPDLGYKFEMLSRQEPGTQPDGGGSILRSPSGSIPAITRWLDKSDPPLAL